MLSEYPRGYMLRIAVLDAITCIIGLVVFAMPFARGWYPGAYDTMLHTTFGGLIAVLAFFRASLAYGSFWIEIVLVPLGLFVFLLPRWMHMQWNPTYNGEHVGMGIAVMVIAVISGLMTIIEMPKIRRNYNSR